MNVVPKGMIIIRKHDKKRKSSCDTHVEVSVVRRAEKKVSLCVQKHKAK